MAAIVVIEPIDVARPYTVFTSPLDLEVLFVLRRTTRSLTGRDIARLVDGRSPSGVQKALRRLVAHGLVHAEEAGRALLYTLNRDHLAAPALEIVAEMRVELERRLRAEIEEWEIMPAHASIFGSAARGNGDTESDIDLFVVRRQDVEESDARWRTQLDQLAADVYRWTGNHLAISEVGERELTRLRREQPPVVDALRKDAITLAGPTPSTLFAGRR